MLDLSSTARDFIEVGDDKRLTERLVIRVAAKC